MRGVNSWPSGLCQYGSSARTDLDTSSSGPVLIGPTWPRSGRPRAGTYCSSVSCQPPTVAAKRIATGSSRRPRCNSATPSTRPGWCSWTSTRRRLSQVMGGPPRRLRRRSSACHSVGWHRRSSCAPGRLPASTSSSAVAILATARVGLAMVDRRTRRLTSRWLVSYRLRRARIAAGELGSMPVAPWRSGRLGVACRSPQRQCRGPGPGKAARRASAGREYRTERSEGGTDRPCRARGGTTLGGFAGRPLRCNLPASTAARPQVADQQPGSR